MLPTFLIDTDPCFSSLACDPSIPQWPTITSFANNLRPDILRLDMPCGTLGQVRGGCIAPWKLGTLVTYARANSTIFAMLFFPQRTHPMTYSVYQRTMNSLFPVAGVQNITPLPPHSEPATTIPPESTLCLLNQILKHQGNSDS